MAFGSKVFFICWFSYVSNIVTAANLPVYLKLCHREDPNLNECVKDSLTSLRPHLEGGIEELDVPAIADVYTDEVTIDRGTRSFNMHLHFEQLRSLGTEKYEVQNVRVDLENYWIELDLKIATVMFVGNYRSRGRILFVPMTGDGKCNITLTGFDYTVKYVGKLTIKDEKSYLSIQRTSLKINKVKRMMLEFGNLLSIGVFGDTVNMFLNQHWQLLLEEIKPALEKECAKFYQKLARNVFDKYPIDELFLP